MNGATDLSEAQAIVLGQIGRCHGFAVALEAPYKHPARIIPVDKLPFNSNGKLMRRQLLERL
ncbi:hypothetical protein [Burkholderia stabilis]|uniref:hypothetical protein n=1 Tax=Burkholderia stabilis TaxID=95485 RepID=UPI001F4A8CA1|nr:hypothetical protein [Burkholderia stabilis]